MHASNDTVPPAVASYTIDDDDSITLPLPFSNRDIPNQQFFESPNLALAAHTLVINITSDGSPYTLDTLKICSQSNSPVAAVLNPTSKTSSHKLSPAVIGGAIVASVGFVLLVVLGIVLLHRKRRKDRARRTAESPVKSWLQFRTTDYISSSNFV